MTTPWTSCSIGAPRVSLQATADDVTAVSPFQPRSAGWLKFDNDPLSEGPVNQISTCMGGGIYSAAS
jgi:hypothetical protein